MLSHLFDLVRTNTAASNYNTDGVDKCNSRYCAIILLVLGTFVITNQLVGDVIDCWTDAQFSGQWVKYTDQMCWVSNTYHLPDDMAPEVGRNTEHMYEIKYYQWVPIILAMQSLLFFLPSMLWSAVADSSIDISNIVSVLSEKDHAIDPEKRDGAVKNLALQFHRYINNRKHYSHTHLTQVRRKLRDTNSFCLSCGSRYGNYLGLIYLLSKVLFVFNAWAQLFCLDSFLGPRFHAYGFEVLSSMYNGVDWTNSKRFPRTTLCDFTVRKMGTIQPVTVQCVLSINLFNERIFLFVWFLLMFMALLNSFNFALWLWRLVLRRNRYAYIRKHLTLMDQMNTAHNIRHVVPFMDDYLQHDGVFVIRLISKNTTSLVVSEMLAALFHNFQNQQSKDKDKSDEQSQPSISSKGSRSGLSSRRSSLQKLLPPSRKGSMPPSYASAGGFSSSRAHHALTNKMAEGLMDDLDDVHSGVSSEPEKHHFPRGDLDHISPDELASIRRFLKQQDKLLQQNQGGEGVPRHHPSAPPVSSAMANNYSVAPTMTHNHGYAMFSSPHDEASQFDLDNHPKALEARGESSHC